MLDQWLLESLQADVVIVSDSATADSGVCVLMVIRIRLGMDDGKLALRGGLKQEFLDSGRGCVGEDDFVRVNVVQCISGDLIVDLAELINDLANTLQHLSSYVFAWTVAREASVWRGGSRGAGK